MIANSMEMGSLFRKIIKDQNISFIKEVRGKGLFNAIEIDKFRDRDAWDLCKILTNNGVLVIFSLSVHLFPS